MTSKALVVEYGGGLFTPSASKCPHTQRIYEAFAAEMKSALADDGHKVEWTWIRPCGFHVETPLQKVVRHWWYDDHSDTPPFFSEPFSIYDIGPEYYSEIDASYQYIFIFCWDERIRSTMVVTTDRWDQHIHAIQENCPTPKVLLYNADHLLLEAV